MSSSPEMDTFLTDGIGHYINAVEAVKTFEREVQERFARLFETKNDWKNFRPKRGARGAGKATYLGTTNESEGRSIWVWQNGETEQDGSVLLRMRWTRPARTLITCESWVNIRKQNSVHLADPRAPVECGPIGNGDAQLFAPLTNSSDLDDLGRLLLAEMDRALGAAA